jgi:hypothetical protein
VLGLPLVADGVVKQRDWLDRRLVDKPGSDDDRVFVGKGLGDIKMAWTKGDQGAQKRDCAAWIALEQTSDLCTRSNQRSLLRRTYAFIELAIRW